MQTKAFLLSILLSGLSNLLYGRPAATLVFSPTTLPNGQYGSVYGNQVIKVTGGTAPYTFSISAGNLPPGFSLSSGGTLSGTPTAAGTYSFTVKAVDNALILHNSGTQAYTVVIAPVALTIKVNNATMVYGAALPGFSATYSGFVNGDDASKLTTAPSFSTTATPASPVGTYPITATGAASPNYTITYTAGVLTIGKAPLTITADGKTMPLGGPLPTLTVSYAGFVNGDNAASLTKQPTITTTATAGSPIGSYPITASGATSNNYTISYVTGILAVGKALLTITANPAGSVYGAALVPNGSLTVSYSGFVNGDGPSSLTTLPTVANAAIAGSPVGTYALIPSGAQSNKYVINYVNGVYTISPAPLTITAANKSMTYGGAVPPLTATYSGFVNGDNASKLTTAPTITTPATPTSPVGSYAINVSGAVDNNYTISYVGGTISIGKATLTVTPDSATMPSGGPLPVFTASYSGFVAGDNVTNLTTVPGMTTTARANSPVGTYPISAAGGASPNYIFIYKPGVLTIVALSQQITWNQSLVIGCIEQTQLTLTAVATSGLPITYLVADTSIATVSGNILTIVKPGTTVITATQPGDAAHPAAIPVKDTLLYEPGSLIRQRWSDVIFFDNSAGYFDAWQWYKDGAAVSGATDPYYSETPALNGKYYVIATDKTGLKVQSCTLDIPAGAAIPGGIRVFPNPAAAAAKVTVTSNYSGTALQGAKMTVIDLGGKVRQTLTNVQPSMQVTMPSETGTYIISLQLASGPRATINVLVVQ